ncbi:PRTRC system protein D [Massilia arenosa]|uniref:PRTRC system protein D n=1 Tax=Zemynaea arenosa TaxID=2561931 RepID=A0A4Y9RWE3_9BURK|nr:PRTRC system protein D [Massilia arenosa]TFW13404.1 PRTRC system protein D [Massilia arenosa]
MEPIVRAVDVGRGNTKYVTAVDGAEIRCAAFPSEAHPTDVAVSGETWTGRRKTVGVPVAGLIYEVGPDVHLAADVYNSRVLQHDRYCELPEYMALTLGALHFMRVDALDLLVVGLPVATFKVRKVVTALEKRLASRHVIGRGREVTIAKVKAIPQPAGALMHFAHTNNCVANMRKERHLIIDVGQRTFDWIVAQGMQQIEKRSHSVNRGMFDVLHAIADGVSRTLGIDFRDYELVDRALRDGRKPVIFQREYDLAKHMPLARKIAEQAVAEMQHYVGDASDVQNIILVGGGAFFFRKAVKESFPRHSIQEVKDPLFANVRGFQIAGMELARAAGTPAKVVDVGEAGDE